MYRCFLCCFLSFCVCTMWQGTLYIRFWGLRENVVLTLYMAMGLLGRWEPAPMIEKNSSSFLFSSIFIQGIYIQTVRLVGITLPLGAGLVERLYARCPSRRESAL
ncbi:hypothetical protein LX32DRAFT_350105 [Colletotrichum zoysiae]|uniref:Uncharacterized protein n=1 Tax=Colletotrichum zoysiae TaxID=1216348 RepID=A0AAD9HIX9_9PEZI|nr:hypothetical protein LX32DRAFT_350105 [Colletotrichum zoysiae]